MPLHRAQAGVLPARTQLEPAGSTGGQHGPNHLTLDPNALVGVHFNQSDKDANTPYLMDCKLMG